MNWTLLFLFIFFGCVSKESNLTSIQGLRDPANLFPTITDISVPASGTYVDTNTLTFNVTFSQVVDVIGVPSLSVRSEQTTGNAVYVSGTGTNILTFVYTIPYGIGDANGIELVSPLKLNGGSIYDLTDDDDAILTFTAPDTSGILINAYTPAITANLAPSNGRYKEAAVMDFTVKYDFEVTIVGTPQLPFKISGTTYYADYVPTSDKKNLTFRYIVGAELYDVGIDIIIGSLNLNGATIRDGFGDNAGITIIPTSFAGVTIDSVKPFSNTTINLPGNVRHYPLSYMLFSVPYSEAVTFTGGSPRLALAFGSGTRHATYLSGSGTSNLFFEYFVQAGDFDVNGFAVTLEANGSVITDLAGNAQTNFALTVGSTAGIIVDTAASTIQVVSSNTTGTYATGAVLQANITFNEIVHVAGGTPKIALNIGGTTKYATYLSGSGTTRLDFRYTVEAGLLDNDNSGPTVVFPILLEGATIKDGSTAEANNAVLTYTDYSAAFVNVDSVLPTITSAVLVNGQGTFRSGDIIDVLITYSKNVSNTGAPSFGMRIGGVNIGASLFAATANTQTYRYTLAGAVDLDGVEFTGIALNGGTIKDALNNAADLTLPASFLSQRLYAAPTELYYWFDVSDPLSATVGGGLMTSFNSKAYSLVGIRTGSAPTVTDDGISQLAKFSSSSRFDYGNINTKYIIIVYEAPPTYGSIYERKLFTLGDNRLHLDNNGDVIVASGGVGCAGCMHFNGSVWVNTITPTTITYLNSYVWNPTVKKIVSLKMDKTAASFKVGQNFEDGQISEIIILNSAGVVAQATLNSIHSYLETKHGNPGF